MAVPVVDAVVARRNRLRAGIAGVRARHEWLDHLSRTGERYFQQRGNHFAAAVTFFSVLTAVPLLMVAFGAAGFVLWLNPTLLDDLRDAITAAVPGALSDAVIPFIDEAVAQRNAVAGLGLLAALWSGIWWTSNLREAVSAQWALPALRPTSVARFWHDLRVLVILGVTLLGSISVSVLATGALDVVLVRLGLADGGVGALVPAAAAAAARAGHRLPRLLLDPHPAPAHRGPAAGRGPRRAGGGGGLRGAQAGDGVDDRQRHRHAGRRGVRPAARPPAVLLPGVAVRAVGVGVGGDGAGQRAPGRAVRTRLTARTRPRPPPSATDRERRRAPGPPGASRGALGVALGVGMLLGAWLGGLGRSSSGGA